MGIREYMIKEGFSDRLTGAFDDSKQDLIARMRKHLSDKVQEVKPLPMWVGIGIFTGLALIGASLGATLATYVFFGICTLAGIIAIVERNKYVKHIVIRMNMFLDLLIFGATIYATAALGVTVGAALTFSGLGFSLVYAPFLRQRAEEDSDKEYIEFEEVTN